MRYCSCHTFKLWGSPLQTEKLSLYEKLARTAVTNLEKNGFQAWFFSKREEAVSHVIGLIPEGSTVGLGDSVSVVQLGVMDYLRQQDRLGKLRLFDRYRHGLTPEDTPDDGKNRLRALTSDVFITGTNAVTLDGKLVNIDGEGTRVAPLIFGPRKVIVVVGANKIVKDTEDGVRRVKEISAPMNAIRHGHKVPCAVTGQCTDCRSPDRLCIYTVVIERQRATHKGRISVVIVGEELGF